MRARETGEGELDAIHALSQVIDDMESQLRVLRAMKEIVMSADLPSELLISLKNAYESERLDN